MNILGNGNSVDNQENQWRKDLTLTTQGLGIFTGLGFLVLSCLVFYEGAHTSQAILWALAFIVLGTTLGFLFAIPKTGKGDISNAASPPPLTAENGNKRTGQAPQKLALQVNTNLEEVSDWLTKIVVGLGLIHLQQSWDSVKIVAKTVAEGIGGTNSQPFESMSAALVIYFSVLGFLGGYLITQLFFFRVFQRVQDLSGQRPDSQDVETLEKADIGIETYEQRLSGQPKDTVQKFLNVPLHEVENSLNRLIAWSKAHYSEGMFERAIQGYRKAAAISPSNIRLKIEYAAALFFGKQDFRQVEQQLNGAKDLIKPTTDQKIKASVYRAITFYPLYSEPPKGFEKAIKYAEEYTTDSKNLPHPAIWINLASGYGQATSYLHENPTIEKIMDLDAQVIKEKALNAVRKACKFGNEWKFRLRMLLESDFPGKAQDDDDLQVFEQDTEFREALGLSPFSKDN